MYFYKVINEFNDFKFGDILVDSSFHWWRKAKLATRTESMKVLNVCSSWYFHNNTNLQKITRDELIKLLPHISKTLRYDAKRSLIIDIDEAVCLDCGKKTNPAYNGKPKSFLTKGDCSGCGKKDVEMYRLKIFNPKYQNSIFYYKTPLDWLRTV